MATLETYRSRVRTKADEENTDFIDNTELDASINAACRFVYRKLAQKNEDLFVRPGTVANSNKFDTVSGTQEYALATDLMKIVRVESRIASSTDDNDYLQVDKLNIGADSGFSYSPLREGYLPHFGYFIAGNNIYFKPVPSQEFTVRIWDVPKFTTLADADDEPLFDNDWDDLVCELAALDLLGTSGEPIFAERFKLYELQMGLLDETAGHRDEKAQVMVMDYNEVGVVR